MLTPLASLLRAVPRVQQLRRMSYGTPAHWKTMKQISIENKTHMDFWPVPQGSWQEAYNKQNSKYNQLLALSVLSLVATCGILWQSGVVYLHLPPPMYNVKKD